LNHISYFSKIFSIRCMNTHMSESLAEIRDTIAEI